MNETYSVIYSPKVRDDQREFLKEFTGIIICKNIKKGNRKT